MVEEVGKQGFDHNETIRDSVRDTEVEIEQIAALPDANLRNDK